jgi:hypothetical protein
MKSGAVRLVRTATVRMACCLSLAHSLINFISAEKPARQGITKERSIHSLEFLPGALYLIIKRSKAMPYSKVFLTNDTMMSATEIAEKYRIRSGNGLWHVRLVSAWLQHCRRECMEPEMFYHRSQGARFYPVYRQQFFDPAMKRLTRNAPNIVIGETAFCFHVA